MNQNNEPEEPIIGPELAMYALDARRTTKEKAIWDKIV